jgi:hypothetical protein
MLKFQVFWDVTPCRLIGTDVAEEVRSTEMSAGVYQLTRRNIPEELNLQKLRTKNLKFRMRNYVAARKTC